MWQQIVAFFELPVPHLLLFTSGSWLVAQVVRLFLQRIVTKIADKTATDLDDLLIQHFTTPVTMAIVLGGTWLGTQQAFPNMGPELHFFLHAALLTVVILTWMFAFLGYGGLLIRRLAEMERFPWVQSRTQPLFTIVVKFVTLAGAVYFIIVAWKQDITGWLASAGVMGIAIGFAAKDTLANLISGIFIIADSPYKLGDYIVLDNGDRGRVTDIGIRSTRLVTRDDVEVIIPNAVMGNSRITNQSGGPHEKFRLKTAAGVAYGSDVDKVVDVLMEVAEKEEMVLDWPEPFVRFRQFGDSSLDFELMTWIENPDRQGLVRHKLLMAIYKALGREGIEIPFPKRDVYIRQLPKLIREESLE